MHIEALTGAAGPDLIAAVRAMLAEYRDYSRIAAGAGFGMAKLEREIAELPGSQLAPGAGYLVAWIEGAPAGGVAFRPLPEVLPEPATELKRLWVRAAMRGRGVAEALVRGVISEARALGSTTLYLDTEPARMPEATRLYRRLGFIDCPLYKPAEEGVAAFRLALAGADSAA
jgi:putative acetyltransferase